MQQKQKPRSRGSVINHRLYSSIFSLIVNIVTLLFHHAIYLVPVCSSHFAPLQLSRDLYH
jgi:hypothetical protein